MSLTQIAELLEGLQEPGFEVYMRIETKRGKPIVFLVHEEIDRSWIPPLLRRQAE